MKPGFPYIVLAAALACLPSFVHGAGQSAAMTDAGKVVEQVVQPLMTQQKIPGLAVGIVHDGRVEIFNYGVASKETNQPVDSDTIFEIGSISKTFTATLASYAQVTGQLSLTDPVSNYLPALQGSSFDRVTIRDLGTHTTGGLPLQVPDHVKDVEQFIQYLKDWQPPYTPGTLRTYSNPGIGLLGMVTARSMKADFSALMTDKLFPALGLKHTYIQLPESEQKNYAEGYTKEDAPVRMEPGVAADEAYGVRTTASDLARYVEANMGMIALDDPWQRAVTATHTAYYQVGPMTQDFVWEQYPYPVKVEDLLQGNSPKMAYEANQTVRFEPPSAPQDEMWLDKTGSTNGFGAYVAFVPSKKLGVVLLANKNYPIAARVAAAHEILARLTIENKTH